jgi:hypothetical protein
MSPGGCHSTTSIKPPTSAAPTLINTRYRAPSPARCSETTSQRVTPDMKWRQFDGSVT